MNFEFTETENAFINSIHEVIMPFTEELDLESSNPQQAEKTLRSLLPRLAEISYLNPFAGGDALSAVAMETLAAHSQSVFLSVETSTRLFGGVVNAWGNEKQKKRWLTPLVQGKIIGALALSEETLNIENDPLKTTGRENDDRILVTGDKSYVVNGPIADWIAVAGTFEDKVAFFMIRKGSRGLVTGKRLETMGYEGAVISPLRLMDCRISEDTVIGPFQEKGILNQLRLWENRMIIGAGLGMMKSSYETAKEYAKTHTSGGKPIIAYQEVGFKLAEMLTLYQTSQLLAYRAIWEAGKNPKTAESLMLCAKVFCTESAEKIASDALKILAGKGFCTANPAERAYRCAKYIQIAGTSTEISRVKIGDEALGY